MNVEPSLSRPCDPPGHTLLRVAGEAGGCTLAVYRRAADGRCVLAIGARPGPPESLLPALLAQASRLDAAWAFGPLAAGPAPAGGLPWLLRETGIAAAQAGVDGAAVGALLAERLSAPLPVPEFLALALGMARCVERLHAAGWLHLNLSPAQFWLDGAELRPEAVRLLFLGCLPVRQAEARPGAPVGGYAYMAPEQSGRMQRPVDARSDLYVLGLCFQRMLAGTLPFVAQDPLEWTHAHLARAPAPLAGDGLAVPAGVAAIIARLLHKVPEQRYQSAAGLVADLHRAGDEWLLHGDVASFPLGREDGGAVLHKPERLFGRDGDLAALAAVAARFAADGQPELLLISGYSGVGKTALILEFRARALPAGALFAAGKFDQFARQTPYATLAQALRTLCRQLLARPSAEVALWRQRMAESLGNRGQVLVDLVPELAWILGPQPAVPALPPEEARHRLHAVLHAWLAVVARREHPFVLFLDDLQWIDPASLQLLLQVLSDPQTRHLLVIGAYRDNEVDAAHPLVRARAALPGRVRVTEHRLAPLDPAVLGELVAAALGSAPAAVAPLAARIWEKTAGNPFFAWQLLALLVDEGLLRIDPESGRWTWADSAIQQQGISDNVLALVLQKLERFPPHTQHVLGVLACLGNEAPLDWLAAACATTGPQVRDQLGEAFAAGLLRQGDGRIGFLHDRIQEAAYALIAPDDRPALHRDIGRRLLAALPAGEAGAQFAPVNQLNLGRALLCDAGERARLRALNLAAARRARAAVALQAAASYLAVAHELLPESALREADPEAIDILLEGADCLARTGDREAAGARFAQLAAMPCPPLARARIQGVVARLHQLDGRYDDAVRATLEGLAPLGLAFPECEAALAGAEVEARARIESLLAGRDPDSLLAAPRVADPRIAACLALLADAMPCAVDARPRLSPLLVLTAVRLALEHGVDEAACFAFSRYSRLLIARYDDLAGAEAFSRMAMALAEQLGAHTLRGTLRYNHAAFVDFWRRPFAATLPLLEEARGLSLDVGDAATADYAAVVILWHLIESGAPLAEIRAAARRHAPADSARAGHSEHRMLRLFGQFAAALQGETAGTDCFDEPPDFREADCVAAFQAAGHGSALTYHPLLKALAWLHAGRWAEALPWARQALAHSVTVLSTALQASCHFYHALCVADALPGLDEAGRGAARATLDDACARLAHWARACPENQDWRYRLLVAERAAHDGLDPEALAGFEGALAEAQRGGLLPAQRLIALRARDFAARRGLPTVAAAFATQAELAGQRWGMAGGAPGQPAAQLDHLTLVRAAQALSGEMRVDRLVSALLTLVVENAGAQRGLLLLARAPDGALQVIAEGIAGDAGIRVTPRHDAPDEEDLPLAVLHFACHARQHVLLDDARLPGALARGPYLARVRPLSVLGLPLVKQGRLVGALYLENRLATHVFTPERVELLEMIAAQAAISLENARLYENLQAEEAAVRELNETLERRVAERTAALGEALLEQEAIFNTALTGIAFSRERIIVRCNAGLERILGYGPGELIGAPIRRLFASETEYLAAGEAAYPLIAAGRPFVGDVAYRRKDGARIWCSEHTQALDPADPGKGVICVLQDISQRKAMEQALADGLAVLERRNREISLLGDLSRALQACDILESAHAILGEQAPALFPGSRGLLLAAEIPAAPLRCAVAWGQPALAVPDRVTEAASRILPGEPARLALVIPVRARDGAVDVLCIETPLTSGGEAAAQPVRRLAQSFAEQGALALANIRLRISLRQQSIRDPLTGLYNRRYLEEFLGREVIRAVRSRTPLALLIADVDHFKAVNDRFGHDMGDQVLQAMARALEATLRQSDVVCRYGGEEFVIVMPGAPLSTAAERGTAILDAVRALRPEHAGRSLERVTVSLGIAALPEHGQTAESLLEAADIALYRAKRGGRDRLVIAS